MQVASRPSFVEMSAATPGTGRFISVVRDAQVSCGVLRMSGL